MPMSLAGPKTYAGLVYIEFIVIQSWSYVVKYLHHSIKIGESQCSRMDNLLKARFHRLPLSNLKYKLWWNQDDLQEANILPK